MKYFAKQVNYTEVCRSSDAGIAYPYLRDFVGDIKLTCISPLHGRSFVVNQNGDGHYVVIKGAGLSYTHQVWLNTHEMGDDTWGLLLLKDALRDFNLGNEVATLGIKTNKMEYVLELDETITLTNGHHLKPILLQYTVECPYRICDAPFMEHKKIAEEVQKWRTIYDYDYDKAYMIAANVLLRNLRILHDNNILHNAIHIQNYTWALELLDFELACSPQYPYDTEDYRRHVKELLPREILQTYEVINYIAWCLHEEIDYRKVDALFKEYGFDLSKYKL